ncbi:hypothetical protein TYRP_008648 [Tyrophagus putrescentiae]|nr:hypothetical protein TYRP_008648 [Tyrophagus putrescentiae]
MDEKLGSVDQYCTAGSFEEFFFKKVEGIHLLKRHSRTTSPVVVLVEVQLSERLRISWRSLDGQQDRARLGHLAGPGEISRLPAHVTPVHRRPALDPLQLSVAEQQLVEDKVNALRTGENRLQEVDAVQFDAEGRSHSFDIGQPQRRSAAHLSAQQAKLRIGGVQLLSVFVVAEDQLLQLGQPLADAGQQRGQAEVGVVAHGPRRLLWQRPVGVLVVRYADGEIEQAESMKLLQHALAEVVGGDAEAEGQPVDHLPDLRLVVEVHQRRAAAAGDEEAEAAQVGPHEGGGHGGDGRCHPTVDGQPAVELLQAGEQQGRTALHQVAEAQRGGGQPAEVVQVVEHLQGGLGAVPPLGRQDGAQQVELLQAGPDGGNRPRQVLVVLVRTEEMDRRVHQRQRAHLREAVAEVVERRQVDWIVRPSWVQHRPGVGVRLPDGRGCRHRALAAPLSILHDVGNRPRGHQLRHEDHAGGARLIAMPTATAAGTAGTVGSVPVRHCFRGGQHEQPADAGEGVVEVLPFRQVVHSRGHAVDDAEAVLVGLRQAAPVGGVDAHRGDLQLGEPAQLSRFVAQLPTDEGQVLQHVCHGQLRHHQLEDVLVGGGQRGGGDGGGCGRGGGCSHCSFCLAFLLFFHVFIIVLSC